MHKYHAASGPMYATVQRDRALTVYKYTLYRQQNASNGFN